MTTAYRDIVSPRLLPPRGLLLSLLAQLPLVLLSWPLDIGKLEIAVGLGLIAFGIILNVWADKAFRAENVGVCPFTPSPKLISSGLYGFTRNPMYVGLITITLGSAVLTGVPGNAWIAATFYIWLHWAYVIPEERWLRENFGSVFEEYAERVPRWLIRWPR